MVVVMDAKNAAKMLATGGAIAGIAVGLVGCGASDPIATYTPTPTEAVSPSESASVSESPSPSTSATESAAGLTDEELLEILPAGAEIPDLQGAVYTAPYFLTEYARMFHTGDNSVWTALSAPSCQYCSSALQNAMQVHRDNLNATGGEIVPRDNTVEANLSDDGSVYVTLTADLNEARLESVEGEIVVSEPAGTAVFTMKLDRLGDVWRVSGVAVDG